MEAYLPRFLANPETILAASIDLQLAIANYIDTPEQLLAILVNSPDRDVAAAAGLHITWAGEIEAKSSKSNRRTAQSSTARAKRSISSRTTQTGYSATMFCE